MADYILNVSVTDAVTGEISTSQASFSVNQVTPPPTTGQCFFGGWDPASGYPGTSWTGLAKFAAAPLKSGTYYLAHRAPWMDSGAQSYVSLCEQHNAVAYINLEPWHTWGGGAEPTMAGIAAGSDDDYYTAFANGINVLNIPILLTFAHEMNGEWYPWGRQNISASTWVAAWKHVVDVMRPIAGDLIQWVWCPNNNDGGRAVTPYWPGPDYVDVAGFDGYLNQDSTSQTYWNFVAPTVAEIRSLSGVDTKPIWNAETGIVGAYREDRITQFVQGMHDDGLWGFVWWNEEDYALSSTEMQALTNAVNAWNA